MVTLKLYIKKLMSWFDYVYYRVYVAYQKKDPDPWMYATSLVTVCPLLNLFIIDTIFEYFTNTYIAASLGKPILYVIAATALVLNYRKYGYNNQRSYQKFHARWKDEPKKLRRKRGIWVLVYILASVLFPMVYGFIKHNIMEGKSFIHG
jgi:ABC-type Fe3+ transport system permease subunit